MEETHHERLSILRSELFPAFEFSSLSTQTFRHSVPIQNSIINLSLVQAFLRILLNSLLWFSNGLILQLPNFGTMNSTWIPKPKCKTKTLFGLELGSEDGIQIEDKMDSSVRGGLIVRLSPPPPLAGQVFHCRFGSVQRNGSFPRRFRFLFRDTGLVVTLFFSIFFFFILISFSFNVFGAL